MVSELKYRFPVIKTIYLNPSSHYDSHEEIRHHTCNHHHQALDHCDARIEAEDEEQVVHKAWVKANHEVAYGAREKCYQHQEWQCWERVADNECWDAIVPIKPLSMENLN